MSGNAFLPAGYRLGDVPSRCFLVKCGSQAMVIAVDGLPSSSWKPFIKYKRRIDMNRDVDDLIFGEASGLHSDR